jgi:hypothetical protein
MPPFDGQLEQVMLACKPLDPSKRLMLMEGIAGYLRPQGIRRPDDQTIEAALRASLRGLLQGSAA